MPVSWDFAGDLIRLGGVGGDKTIIAPGDAARQTETARSILDSLRLQPGIVLADEVGMGKTYVAMAVIGSVLLATKGRPPVVVMTPPGLASKWRAEWLQFKATCLTDPKALGAFRDTFAGNPTEFFRAMGEASKRSHLIWMSTGCFSRGLQDPWVKLALCRIARSKTRMSEEARNKFYKWADVLVRMKARRQVTVELIRGLMDIPLERWHEHLIAKEIIAEGDPSLVPRHLIRHADQVDCTSLVEVLNGGAIPGRRGLVSGGRLSDARWQFNQACQVVYVDWMRQAVWDASLLVLDEAHHAKNDGTWLARMFRPRDLEDVETLVLGRSSDHGTKPIFWGKFDRLLFLTATPFQLGHDELIRVLRSFAAARWSGQAAPAHDRERFFSELKNLEARLNENRKCGRRLDELWSKVTRERVTRFGSDAADVATAATAWWESAEAGAGDPFDREVAEAVRRFLDTKAMTETDPLRPWASLPTWVIRHNRPLTLPPRDGQVLPRRIGRHGRAILAGDETGAEGGVGLDLGVEDPLPFLLAARAQGELAGSPGRGRAFFAEGLASSYEAFHHTREGRGVDVRDGVQTFEGAAEEDLTQSVVPVTWYERQVEAFVPDRLRMDEAGRHPKIHAVVRRAVDLWRRGEKVLIFCTYRQTAQALREHLRHGIDQAIHQLVIDKAGLPPGRTAEARRLLERVARRLADPDGAMRGELVRFLNGVLGQNEFQALGEYRDRLLKLLLGYVRSHSFIARYLALGERAEGVSSGAGNDSAADAAALAEAIEHTTDLSGMTLRGRVKEFLRFALELAERGRAAAVVGDDEDPPDPLGEYLYAVAVSIRPRDVARDEGTKGGRGMSFRALHVVRMVYGETPRDVRERVMLAFNSPLFPEVLVSSAVLGEGVDLHRFCRFVIHHDLSWNPSVIEQRTGRLDRIRCRAETAGRPIVVYEPYIAESADEKLYRVLRDRERWFQVVMGQKFSFDERTAEKIADRVPLPPDLARRLLFDLRRYREGRLGDEVQPDSP